MRRLLAATLALSLVAACGGSDGESEPSATDAATELTTPVEDDAPVATDAPAQDVDADAAAAEAALLTLSDFPAGWSEAPDTADEELREGTTECFGPDAVELRNGEAQASTSVFADPQDESRVDQTVTVAPTLESAEAYMAAASADGVAECLTTVFRERLPEVLAGDEATQSVEVGEVVVGALNVGPIGEETFAYRITSPLTNQGLSVDVVLDFVSVRVGRSAAGINFVSQGDPQPIERITEYTTLAASRLPG